MDLDDAAENTLGSLGTASHSVVISIINFLPCHTVL